jgi:hypothetical protein
MKPKKENPMETNYHRGIADSDSNTNSLVEQELHEKSVIYSTITSSLVCVKKSILDLEHLSPSTESDFKIISALLYKYELFKDGLYDKINKQK